MAHYVNNATMLESIKAYKSEFDNYKKNGGKEPRIPEYLGECILKIANKLSHKPNFINYSYRDDMISDGIENCIMCINSFNPEKSSNPFAYFTQVIYFAFIRRIQREKKQSYIKSCMIKEMPFSSYDAQSHDKDDEFTAQFNSFIQTYSNFDDSFLKKKEKKAQAKVAHSLELFAEDYVPEEPEELTDEVQSIIDEIQKDIE